MLKLGALWLKESKQGKKFMTGIIENDSLPHIQKIPVVVFKNEKKQSDKSPDYLIFLSEDREFKKSDDVPF